MTLSQLVKSIEEDKQFIQLTAATNYGAVAQGGFVPLGVVTRKFVTGTCNQPTFVAGTTGNNTVTITDAGEYKVTYTGTALAGAAGAVTFNLLLNIALTFIVRVFGNCASIQNAPATIQILNTGVELTGGTGNLIVERKI